MKYKKAKYKNHIVDIVASADNGKTYLIKYEYGWKSVNAKELYEDLDVLYISKKEFINPNNRYYWVYKVELKLLEYSINISIK